MGNDTPTSPKTWANVVKELGNLGMGFAALIFAFGLLAYREYQQQPIELDRVRNIGRLADVLERTSRRDEEMDKRITAVEKSILRVLEDK